MKPLSSLILIISFAIATLVLPAIAWAKDTHLIIRVKSKDAKFIGTSMGGARIVIRNAYNGEILAEGITAGGTGDTEKIMKTPHQRNVSIADEETAFYKATLDINEPVFAIIEAYAPLNNPQAIVKGSLQLWIIPGKHVEGEGIILEVPGFVVEIDRSLLEKSNSTEQEILLKAKVQMLCGCPITLGGLWDSEQYEVTAIISKNGEVVRQVNLDITNEPSLFEKEVSLNPGSYALQIYAFDPETGNSGLDSTTFNVH